ncbi:Alpha/Beta hydrolase protein [Crucibulum laeve]|uniref:Alpha/Beta hydrolase protein n=1 Tax=Crucibulum laeve TaxID=68775 RepID=A0A5C3MDB2_9AGAR|nr:Alpha/Beta hydrolase protein [Crucibulum laeve]
MPYVDLHSADDYASIYYTTSAPCSNVGGFDPEKPTIIILHPLFLDSSWLDNHLGDPRLYTQFNMIAFDMRVSGRSSSRPSGKHDSWVDAADIALCHQRLQLPPCHILALEGISINCALRFAVLFPEMCASLALCNVPAPTELKWVFTALDEILQTWCFADDIESFQHSGMECINLLIGPDCDPDLQDEIIAYWETTIPPRQRHRAAETVALLMNRTPMKPEAYALIKQPVLLIHGERNEMYPKKYSEKLASQLVNAEGGAVVYTVRGAAGSVTVVPGSASIANQVFARFLSRLPKVRSELVPPAVKVKDRMQTALELLAEITGDSSYASRDPMSSLSFSCLPDDLAQSQLELLQHYCKAREHAFCPLDEEGKPLRKYSDSKRGHWFHGGKDGLSVADSDLLPPDRATQEAGKHLPVPRSEPISQKAVNGGQLRKVTPFTPNTVETYIVKGSMAKVVSSAPATPLQRLLS